MAETPRTMSENDKAEFWFDECLKQDVKVKKLEGHIEELERQLAHWKDCHGVTADALANAEHKLATARQQERERCAKVCEERISVG